MSPRAGIDIAGEQTFYDLVSHLHREHGTTVVMVSHELDVVANYADQVSSCDFDCAAREIRGF
jgi:ABC-type Mn2+/Zn2+ transport system ATPase subunit